jgi:hypothetical protein
VIPEKEVILAERRVIGTMMNGGFTEAIEAVGRYRLGSGHFSRAAHGEIFDVLCDLSAAGEPVDPLLVFQELRRRAEAAGAHLAFGVDGTYLFDCVAQVPSNSHVSHYAEIVIKAARDRRVRETLATAAGRLREPNANGEEVAGWAIDELGRVTGRGTTPAACVTSADENGFWDSRATLAHVHNFARARMASPWATLAVTLVRVLSKIPPNCVLPKIIGNYASLNTFVGVVATSGVGKGAAQGAADDAFDVGEEVEVVPIGTGEGMVKSYIDRVGADVVQHAPRRYSRPPR